MQSSSSSPSRRVAGYAALRGPFVPPPGAVPIPLHRGDSVWVPADIAVQYGHLRWHPRIRDKDYISATINGRNIYLHRLIMRAPASMVVHHLDGNPLNCMRENMVLTTRAKNAALRAKPRTATSSQYLGVSRAPRSLRYHAQIVVDGVRFCGGWHADEVDAAHAYDRLARIFRGALARVNFPDSSPGV